MKLSCGSGSSPLPLQHWITGRAVVLLALVNILIGIQVCHIAWMEPTMPWMTAYCLLIAVLLVLGGVLEVMGYRRGLWQPLPGNDIGGGNGGALQMRSIQGHGAGPVRPTEGTPLLLHNPHTLE